MPTEKDRKTLKKNSENDHRAPTSFVMEPGISVQKRAHGRQKLHRAAENGDGQISSRTHYKLTASAQCGTVLAAFTAHCDQVQTQVLGTHHTARYVPSAVGKHRLLLITMGAADKDFKNLSALGSGGTCF